MDRKRSSRMASVPQIDIPDIYVDDGDDGDDGKAKKEFDEYDNAPASPVSPTHLSVDGASPGHARGLSAQSNSAWRVSGANHPLSFPRSASSTPSPPGTPSGFGFEIQDTSPRRRSGELSRPTSAVSPSQARDMLEDSVWLDSIRRSTTKRRSERGSDAGPYR